MADIGVDDFGDQTAQPGNKNDIVSDEFLEGLKYYMIALIVVGSAGNLLVLVSILTNRALHNPLNMYLANLACTDFFISVALNPASLPYYEPDAMEEMGCGALGFSTLLCLVVTTASLGLISANLYIRVCRRQNYLRIYTRRNVYLSILVLWLVVFLVLMPPLFGLGRYGYNDYIGSCLFSNDYESNLFALVAIEALIIGPTFLWTLFAFFAVFRHFNVIHENAEYFQHHDLASFEDQDSSASSSEQTQADEHELPLHSEILDGGILGGTVLDIGPISTQRNVLHTSLISSTGMLPTAEVGETSTEGSSANTSVFSDIEHIAELSHLSDTGPGDTTESSAEMEDGQKTNENNIISETVLNTGQNLEKLQNGNEQKEGLQTWKTNNASEKEVFSYTNNSNRLINNSNNTTAATAITAKAESIVPQHQRNRTKNNSCDNINGGALAKPHDHPHTAATDDTRKVKKWSIVGQSSHPPLPELYKASRLLRASKPTIHSVQEDVMHLEFEGDSSIGSIRDLEGAYSFESLELIGLDDQEVLEVMQLPYHLTLAQKQRALAAIEEKELKETEHFTKNLFVLWLTFMVFWMPFIMGYDLIYVAFVPRWTIHLFFIFGQTTSSVQFIIHALMSPKFREAYKRTITFGLYGRLEGHLL